MPNIRSLRLSGGMSLGELALEAGIAARRLGAFEHGLASGRGRVDVTIDVDGEQLRCVVADDGRGLAPGYVPGVGLANVRHRLELLYPGRHRFTIAPGKVAGTRIEIELPLSLE